MQIRTLMTLNENDQFDPDRLYEQAAGTKPTTTIFLKSSDESLQCLQDALVREKFVRYQNLG